MLVGVTKSMEIQFRPVRISTLKSKSHEIPWKKYTLKTLINAINLLFTDGNVMALTSKEPVGVIGQIIPWNYPLLMVDILIEDRLPLNTFVLHYIVVSLEVGTSFGRWLHDSDETR